MPLSPPQTSSPKPQPQTASTDTRAVSSLWNMVAEPHRRVGAPHEEQLRAAMPDPPASNHASSAQQMPDSRRHNNAHRNVPSGMALYCLPLFRGGGLRQRYPLPDLPAAPPAT